VPLTILDKPNLISAIDFKKNQLEYYPLNAEGTTVENDLLACTLLKFYLDTLTEYKGNGKNLRNQENQMIQNIDRADTSIIDVTAFNVLHNNFSL
jgi:hypothetical protein